MNSRDNCISIIEDCYFTHYSGDVKCTRTKKGYKVKYKKNRDFLKSCDDDDYDFYCPMFVLVWVVVGLLQLVLVSLVPSIFVWCIIPALSLGLSIYSLVNSRTAKIDDLVLGLWYFVVSVIVTWIILVSASNGNWFNVETKHGGRMDKYVREHVDPSLIKFYNEK
jgi:hypothetical protein